MNEMESNIVFGIIPKDKIPSLWWQIEPQLSRADDNTMTADELYTSLIDHEADEDLWAYMVGEDVKYYLTASKTGNTYFISRVAGGGKHNPWPKIKDILAVRANQIGCSALGFCGDKRWDNVLKGLGFQIVQYYYNHPIKKEEE